MESPGRASNPPHHRTARHSRGRTAKSCQLCHLRKVRCDKKRPCSNCSRAAKPCTYPSTQPASSPPKARSLHDSAAAQPSPASVMISETTQNSLSEDVLVKQGSAAQYFNEILHSQAIGGHGTSNETNPGEVQSDHYPSLASSGTATGIVFPSAPVVAPCSFHPPKQAAISLWNTYVENVEACSMLKVLHMPTDELRIFTSIENPQGASLENLALCFAVYYSSLNSLRIRHRHSAYPPFEHDKAVDLIQFKLGLEQSLAQSNFLDSPTITTLKALAIYLSALRIKNHGNSVWALSGLAIRLAQSMGLHRNGERLGLSPFESEIRRRLWWHLLIRDGRAGEDYGQRDSSNLALTTDVAEPLNIDDNCLYPELTELPKARDCFTAMTFNNINIDFSKAQQQLLPISDTSATAECPTEAIRAQIISSMAARVQDRLQKCSPAIPRQRFVLMISHFVQRKLDLVSRLQWLARQPQAGSNEAFATDENLAEAVDILRLLLSILEDVVVQPYIWSIEAFPQHYVLLYVLWHLCVRPEGSAVPSAWEVLASVSHSLLWDGVREHSGPTAAVLNTLKTTAETKRVNHRTEGGDPGSGVQSEQRDVPADEHTLLMNLSLPAENAFRQDIEELPNWPGLLEELQWTMDSL